MQRWTKITLLLIFILPTISFAEEGLECPVRYGADGPFFHGNFAQEKPTVSIPKSDKDSEENEEEEGIKLVTYNINFGKKIGDIFLTLEQAPELQNADVIVLQEVTGSIKGDEDYAKDLAQSLNMNYFFAPGTVLSGDNYGNAILSRFPMKNYRKVLLPHPKKNHCNQRTAVGVTLTTPNGDIEVYSIHLHTLFRDSLYNDHSRVKQIQTALSNINDYKDNPVFIAGDFNNVNPFGWSSVRAELEKNEFTYHDYEGWSFWFLRKKLDHIFSRGLSIKKTERVPEAQGSDHLPVYTVITI